MSVFPILPIPTSGWRFQAACRGESTETFFLSAGQRGVARRRREAAAKAVCADCPVSRQCLNWALRIAEPYGVWGGTTPEERNAMLGNSHTGKAGPVQYPTHGPDQELPTAG